MSIFENIRFDNWKNLLTGLGVKGKDKRMDTEATWLKMTQLEAEQLYAADEIATKVVDYPIEEMFVEGYKFTYPDCPVDWHEKAKAIWDKYQMEEKFIDGGKKGRLYGEAYLLFSGLGGEVEEEIELDQVKGLDWCRVVHKWDLTAVERQRDISKKYYKEPIMYSVDDQVEDSLQVHRSRLIVFKGAHLPDHLYELNNYTHDSVLQKIQNSLRNYNMAFDSSAVTLQEFSMGIYKMKDLAKLIGSGKENQVLTRLGLIDAKKSMVRSIVLDMNEDYKRETVNLGGVSDIQKNIGNKLVADTNMPHTVLLGEGAAGTLGGGGESERKDWNKYISKKQNAELKPNMIHAMTILLKAEGEKVPEGLTVEFNPLWQPSETEKATIRKTTSEADKIDIESGILDPDEVAISRYGSDEYSTKTKIDVEIRRQNLSEGEEDIDPTPEDGNPEDKDLENIE